MFHNSNMPESVGGLLAFLQRSISRETCLSIGVFLKGGVQGAEIDNYSLKLAYAGVNDYDAINFISNKSITIL